jgi:hypothetical protein
MERKEGAAKVGAGGTAAIRADALAKADRLENSYGGQLVATMKSRDAAVSRANKAQLEVDALVKEIDALNEKIERVRRQKLRVSAMSDDEIADNQRTADWIFGALLKKPGEPIDVACLGENMSPTIKDGEVTYVDTAVRSFAGDGIYCLEVGRFRLIRRLVERDDGALLIVSDNPDKHGYPDQLVPVDERWKISVVGKVISWIRVCKP